jgi:hypothetical protein
MSLLYLPRSAWNAAPVRGTPVALTPANLKGVALHYPAMGARTLLSQTSVAAALRGWQDYHMAPKPKGRGWSDIAYQVAVDQAGRKWNLRGLTTRSGANGDGPANEAYGAILLVVGDDEEPTGAMVQATQEVVRDWRRLYPKATEIQTHNAVRTRYTGEGTDCPGTHVSKLIAAGAFNPPATPSHPEGDSEMNQTDRDYVDARIKAYTRWMWMEQTALNLQVAKLRGDNAPTIAYLTTTATQARKDWEALTK